MRHAAPGLACVAGLALAGRDRRRQARLDGGDVVFLGFTRGGRRIAGVGCRPAPSGGTMNCEQEP